MWIWWDANIRTDSVHETSDIGGNYLSSRVNYFGKIRPASSTASRNTISSTWCSTSILMGPTQRRTVGIQKNRAPDKSPVPELPEKCLSRREVLPGNPTPSNNSPIKIRPQKASLKVNGLKIIFDVCPNRDLSLKAKKRSAGFSSEWTCIRGEGCKTVPWRPWRDGNEARSGKEKLV